MCANNFYLKLGLIDALIDLNLVKNKPELFSLRVVYKLLLKILNFDFSLDNTEALLFKFLGALPVSHNQYKEK